MPNRNLQPEDKTNHLLLIPKEISELLVWVQEHANLCVMLSLCPISSKETHHKIRLAITESQTRGNNLLNNCISQVEFNYTNHKDEELPFSHINLPRREFHIPLSGANRFDKDNALKKEHLVIEDSSASEHSKEILPSRTYLKKKIVS